MRISDKNLNDIKSIEKEKKVFLIGMSKTGTTSMEQFLENLGYRVCKGNWNNKDKNFLAACYCFNQIDEIINLTNYYDGFGDAPWGGTDIYKKLVEIYPNAYYILTIRDTIKWYNSLIAMYQQFDKNLKTSMETMRSFGSYGSYIFFKKIFQIETLADMDAEIKIKTYFDNYNKEVKKFFKNNKYNFLEIDITDNSSADSIILDFLNKKNISISIPHLNQGNY